MTWLGELPPGETDWHRLSTVKPESFAAMAQLLAAAWQEVDPVLLELCRLRTATILRYAEELERRSDTARSAGVSDAKVDELAAWPTSPLFTDTERACLALAEQFVIDANGVTESHVAAVTEKLGAAGCYAFVQAISALETFQRACLTMGIRTMPDVDELARWSTDDPLTRSS